MGRNSGESSVAQCWVLSYERRGTPGVTRTRDLLLRRQARILSASVRTLSILDRFRQVGSAPLHRVEHTYGVTEIVAASLRWGL
jgi:hypothetical protein